MAEGPGDLRPMSMGNLKAAGLTVLALATLGLSACGSGGGGTTVAAPPPIAAATAGHLAKLSDRVASDLGSGDTCHAAHAADDLRAAVEEADIPRSMRPGVDAVAGRLVDEVNCPPPPPPPPPEPKKKPKDEHLDEHHGDQHCRAAGPLEARRLRAARAREAERGAGMTRHLGDRYELGARLGHGGMATVYGARDTKLDRDVAIKLLADNFAGDDEVRRRFSREARLAAKLDHPNIVQVFDVGEDEDRPYIVMEQVEGGTLGDRLDGRRRSIPGDEAVGLLCQLCDGLGHAHAKKLVHRDIKPQNLLVRTSDGCLKITDFGIARAAEETTRLTQAGKVIGTERYMAPEQLADGRITPAADVYACGVVADELLPQSRSPELREIVERCMSEDPSDRFPDARSLGEALATANGNGQAGAVRRIRSQTRPTRRLPPTGPVTSSWPAPAGDRKAPPFRRQADRGGRGGIGDRRGRRADRDELGRLGVAGRERGQAAAGARRVGPDPRRSRATGARARGLLPRPVSLTTGSSSGREP